MQQPHADHGDVAHGSRASSPVGVIRESPCPSLPLLVCLPSLPPLCVALPTSSFFFPSLCFAPPCNSHTRANSLAHTIHAHARSAAHCLPLLPARVPCWVQLRSALCPLSSPPAERRAAMEALSIQELRQALRERGANCRGSKKQLWQVSGGNDATEAHPLHLKAARESSGSGCVRSGVVSVSCHECAVAQHVCILCMCSCSTLSA
jgi:hypothetical protein